MNKTLPKSSRFLAGKDHVSPVRMSVYTAQVPREPSGEEEGPFLSDPQLLPLPFPPS